MYDGFGGIFIIFRKIAPNSKIQKPKRPQEPTNGHLSSSPLNARTGGIGYGNKGYV